MPASDTMLVSATSDTPPAAVKTAAQVEVQFAKCECCGLTEEYTPGYIERVRKRYHGKWICGLCSEAIEEEIDKNQRLISIEEAMARHMSFCKKFNPAMPPLIDPAVHWISAMRRLLRRSLDSPRGLKSSPNSPTTRGDQKIARSESCFSSLSG